MTYIAKVNNIKSSSPQQPSTIHWEKRHGSQRRCPDTVIVNLLPSLMQKKISYYGSKQQINEGICPQWLSEIMTCIDMSEGDIAFLMSNLKDFAPDSSLRIKNYQY